MRADTGDGVQLHAGVAAAETGTAIGRKHATYVTDILRLLRALTGKALADDAYRVLWSAYLREVQKGMAETLGDEAAANVLTELAAQAQETRARAN